MRWAASGAQNDPHPGDFSIYILTNVRRTVLYIGVTNGLEKRLSEHGFGGSGFTSKYHATVLIYCENYPDPLQAIAREKQLKRWSRQKKLALIRTQNPELRDLGTELFGVGRPERSVIRANSGEGADGTTNQTCDENNPDLPRGPSTARRLPPSPARRSARDDRDWEA